MKAFAIISFISFITSATVPPRNPGFSIGNPHAPSRIDIFYDPHCPASQDHHSLFKKVLATKVNNVPLIDQISITYHYQALPYHKNSFLSTKILKYLERKHPGSVIPFLELIM